MRMDDVPGTGLPGALQEQADGIRFLKRFDFTGQLLAIQVVNCFPLQIELLAGSYQDLDLGRGNQNLLDE